MQRGCDQRAWFVNYKSSTAVLSKQPSEHYFEMSRVDASQALSLYRQFCKQTERVVEYLGVAKKLQNLLNVPIPNLKYVRR
jgi:hypothetical protein